MKISLLQVVDGFLETINEDDDHNLKVDHWDLFRWMEDRDLDNKILKLSFNIMPVVNFIKFIETPLKTLSSGNQQMDTRPNVTNELVKLMTLGLTYKEWTHVIFNKGG